MVDTSMRDYRNAEASIKGALKDKKGKDEFDNQYLHSMNIGSYNKFGLHTVITVLSITIVLILAAILGPFYLLLLVVIYAVERYFDNKRKTALAIMNAKLLKASEERKGTDPLSVFTK